MSLVRGVVPVLPLPPPAWNKETVKARSGETGEQNSQRKKHQSAQEAALFCPKTGAKSSSATFLPQLRLTHEWR
ncbi:MAG TPA: hypothetical protein VM865_02185 [Acidobacteriaceae bacterium]|nr:hypothetical protein [Acidobacteriaceae bacterium]